MRRLLLLVGLGMLFTAPAQAQISAGRYVRFAPTATATTPPAGYINARIRLSDSHLILRDSTATDTDLSAGGLSSVTADSPLAGAGTSGSHLTCSLCMVLNATPTDDTYSFGDATHRLVNLGVKNLLSGASTDLVIAAHGSTSTFKDNGLHLSGQVFVANASGLVNEANTAAVVVGYSDTAVAIYGGDLGSYADFTASSGSPANRWKITRTGHLSGATTAPTCVAGTGADAIGGGSCSTLSGSTDLAGTLRVSAGTAPSGAATIATVSFIRTYEESAPRCVFSPASSNAAGLFGVDKVYIDQSAATTSVFVLKNGTVTGIAGSTIYDWNYVCVQ